MRTDRTVVESWEAEYRSGRYVREPPVDFVQDILAAARRYGLARGLYVGCGNGRNFVPLVEGGLDLEGLDVSPTAIRQLAQRLPSREGRLRVGDLADLPSDATFPIVIGIQVFQHGDRSTCQENVRAAQRHLAPRGLFCLRVNAIGGVLEHRAELVESAPDGSETVRYVDGPKRGLRIHFFSRPEIEELFDGEYSAVLPLRLQCLPREPPGRGFWCQWEAIWQRSSDVREAGGSRPPSP